MTEIAPDRRAILLRGLRARCPACGVGRVFERGFESVARCRACGFVFERGPGHWVGGNEINVIVTYPVSCLALVVPCVVWGGSWITATVGGVLALAIGLALHRPARGLFFAIDYLVEPHWEPGDDDRDSLDDGDGGGGAPPVQPDRPDPLRRRGEAIELPVPVPAPRIDAEPAADAPATCPRSV